MSDTATVADEWKVTACDGCAKSLNCLHTGLGFAQKKWLCGNCLRQALGSLLDEEDRKYERERLQDKAHILLEECRLLNGAGDRNSRLKAKARFRAYKALKRKLYG